MSTYHGLIPIWRTIYNCTNLDGGQPFVLLFLLIFLKQGVNLTSFDIRSSLFKMFKALQTNIITLYILYGKAYITQANWLLASNLQTVVSVVF